MILSTRIPLGKPYLTFVVNASLAFVASIIAYFTDWLILVPVLFAIGIPIVNLDMPAGKKAMRTFAITLSTLAIFIAAVIASLNINYHNYLLQGLVVGAAGVMILLVNGYFVDSIRISAATVLLTFVLSGVSFPLWVFTDKLLPESIANIDIIPEFGSMMYWMCLTTIGIAMGMRGTGSH